MFQNILSQKRETMTVDIKAILSLDQIPDHRYSDWLLKINREQPTYSSEDIEEHDLYYLGILLKAYRILNLEDKQELNTFPYVQSLLDFVSQNIQGQQLSIDNINISEIMTAIENFKEIYSAKQVKIKSFKESIVLIQYDKDNKNYLSKYDLEFQIFYPTSLDSIGYFCENTYWNVRKILDYDDFISLYIKLPSNIHIKCNISNRHNKIEFIDMFGNYISREEFRYHFPYLEGLLLCSLKKSPESIKWLDESMFGENFCQKALEINPEVYQYFPKEIQGNPNLIEIALRLKGKNLEFVPRACKTEKTSVIAIEQDYKSFQYILDKHKTKELCQIAISKNGILFKKIPSQYQTKEFFDIAIMTAPEIIKKYPRFFADPYQYKDIQYKNILDKNPLAINDIPPQHRTHNIITEEMARIAILADGALLQYIPDQFKTIENCKLAIQRGGVKFYDLPIDLRKISFYEVALTLNGQFITEIPESDLTRKFCEIALRHGANLDEIPEEFYDYNLCMISLEHNTNNIHSIPRRFFDLDMCRFSIERNPSCYRAIPHEFLEKLHFSKNPNMYLKNKIFQDIIENLKIFYQDFSPIILNNACNSQKDNVY